MHQRNEVSNEDIERMKAEFFATGRKLTICDEAKAGGYRGLSMKKKLRPVQRVRS